MALQNTVHFGDLNREQALPVPHAKAEPASTTAVSWSAILAGAAGTAALSLILLMLGTGLGLSSVSPWVDDGIDQATLGISTIAWVTFTQVLASGTGGYLAGRLRTKWVEVPHDEVHFRDTAHGFLAWAVASLVTAALLTTALGSLTRGGVAIGTAANTVGASVLLAGAETAKSDDPADALAYFIDVLFRRDAGAATSPTPEVSGAVRAEVSRIFLNTLAAEALPIQDVRHVGQLVMQRTGLSRQEAERRVSDTHARAQTSLREARADALQAADATRKAAAHAVLWLFISLLSGAFAACLAATVGGRQRHG